MDLSAQLAETGVTLSKEIGVIIESYDHAGHWSATMARVGRVCCQVPELSMADQEKVTDFDPKRHLAVLVGTNGAKDVVILRQVVGAVLHRIDGGGLVIETEKHRIIIGQSQSFMDSVYGLMCALAPKH